jgi:thioesterase domain-containing protein
LQLRALFEQPTIAAISAQIEKPRTGVRANAARPIVSLNKSGTRTPLIFFHGDLFAEGLYFRRLAAALGPDQPVHSVAPHGTAGLPLLPTIQDMARDYAEKIRSVQEHGPYRLGGYCSSGLIAYEVGRILRASGETVERVVLLNSSPMPSKRIAALDWLLRRVGSDSRLKPRLRDSFCYNLARVHAALVTSPRALLAALRLMLRSSVARARTANLFEPLPFEERRSVQETSNSFGHVVAALTYHAPRYDGDVTLIWGEDQPTMLDDRTMGWGGVARAADVIPMHGGHVGVLSGRVAELAAAFDLALGAGKPSS